MGKFTGKTAVITGSGRRKGLGEAIAKRLAEDGANIVISDIGAPRDEATGAEHIGSTDEMEAIAADMRALGVEASTKVCDVRSLEDVRALAQHAVDTHGSLDIWVNNAGIGYIMKPLLEVTEEDWRAVIDVNLTGAFFGVKAAAETMVKQGKGGLSISPLRPRNPVSRMRRPILRPSMVLSGLSARQLWSLAGIRSQSTMFARTMSRQVLALGRMSISPKSSAQTQSKIILRRWPTVSRWGDPACRKIPPMQWLGSAPMKRAISPRRA